MNVGQFRRNQINSYGQNINVSLSTQETNSSSESISGSDLIFENICINLEENNSLQNGSHYYLKFGVQKMDGGCSKKSNGAYGDDDELDESMISMMMPFSVPSQVPYHSESFR